MRVNKKAPQARWTGSSEVWPLQVDGDADLDAEETNRILSSGWETARFLSVQLRDQARPAIRRASRSIATNAQGDDNGRQEDR